MTFFKVGTRLCDLQSENVVSGAAQKLENGEIPAGNSQVCRVAWQQQLAYKESLRFLASNAAYMPKQAIQLINERGPGKCILSQLWL